MRTTRLAAAACAILACDALFLRAERPVRIEQAGWLAGCWEAASPERTIEEQWSAPRGRTMLGTSRTVRDGETTEYEFVVLKEQDAGLAYEAHPSRQPSAVFLSRELSASRIVFENAEHDYPQRIGYEQRGADSLMAWIDGRQNGRTRRVDFPYRRVACR